MSGIEAALRRAGYRSPDERLAALLTEMLAANAGAFESAVSAALAHIRDREPALAWALHAEMHHRRAVMMRMETIRAEMVEAERRRRAAEASGAGQPRRDDHGSDARPTTKAPQGAGGGGHSSSDDQQAAASPAPDRPSAAITPAARAAQSASAARGLLASVQVNGKPLANALPEEARAAGRAKLNGAKHEAAQGRFLLVMAANLPPEDPIGRWRNAEDAEAVMASAKAWAEGSMNDAEL